MVLKKREEVKVPEIETTEVVVEIPKIELNELAFSIIKDGGSWYLVKIPFDFKTLTVGTPEKISEGEVKSLAMERFRIEAGKMMAKNP